MTVWLKKTPENSEVVVIVVYSARQKLHWNDSHQFNCEGQYQNTCNSQIKEDISGIKKSGEWISINVLLTPISLSRLPLGICLSVVPTAQRSSQKGSRGSSQIETVSPHDRCSQHRRSRPFLGLGCPGAAQRHTVGRTSLDRYTAPETQTRSTIRVINCNQGIINEQ